MMDRWYSDEADRLFAWIEKSPWRRPAEAPSQLAGGQHVDDRFLLWIDAVGGYLVCAKDRVTLGRAAPESTVDIPIQADIARHHTAIERQGDCYLIHPAPELFVQGKAADQPRFLRHGDVIQLGTNVALRFHQPHALSATARLEWASHHRTRPATDGVVLFAESCVLGPASSAHIPCRRWRDDVILYRCEHDLCVRSATPYEIDGSSAKGRSRLKESSRVVGRDFSFCLEELP